MMLSLREAERKREGIVRKRCLGKKKTEQEQEQGRERVKRKDRREKLERRKN